MKSYGNWGVMTKRRKGLGGVTLIPNVITLEELVVVAIVGITFFMIAQIIPSELIKICMYVFGGVLAILAIIPVKKNNNKRLWKIIILSFRKQPRNFKTENKNLLKQLKK